MSVEDQLRAELKEQRESLRRLAGDSFTTRLLRMEAEDRIGVLQSRLVDARTPKLELLLEGPDGYGLPAETAGGLLSGLQKAFTWSAHAIRSGPGVEKEPPASLRRATQVDVQELVPGSFQIVLRAPGAEPEQEELELGDEQVVEQAVFVVLDLAEAAERGMFVDEVEVQARSLGARTSRYIQGVMNRLHETGGSAAFSWRGRGRSRVVTLSSEAARSLSTWLSEVETATEEVTVRGTLLMADVEDGRFKLMDAAGNVYAGKSAPELVDNARINAEYQARLSVIHSRRDHIGVETDRYVLLSLDARGEGPIRQGTLM